MFGRTPYEAIRNFRSSLQRTISCVTSSVITVRGVGYHPGSEHVLILGEVEAAKLPEADVALSVRLFTRVQEHDGRPSQWRVNPTTYFYTLEERRVTVDPYERPNRVVTVMRESKELRL